MYDCCQVSSSKHWKLILKSKDDTELALMRLDPIKLAEVLGLMTDQRDAYNVGIDNASPLRC